MKMRVKGNSIRLRLTRGEVAEFGRGGLVEETVEFGPGTSPRFVYAVSASEGGGAAPSASFEGNRLTVFVPKESAREWAEGDRVGIRAEQPLGGGKTLGILIEKDFACLDERPGEDESDAFPHPAAGKAC